MKKLNLKKKVKLCLFGLALLLLCGIIGPFVLTSISNYVRL